ncbi:MAG TPA: GFA family protein [Candidatus Udaeobacter sp.]|jgi:hypothetical protein
MRGEPLEMGYCHCENCRRYSAAPVSAFTLWKKENVTVTKGAEFLGNLRAATSATAVIAQNAPDTSSSNIRRSV